MTDDLDLVRRLSDDADCDPAVLDRERSRWTAFLHDPMHPRPAAAVKPEHRALSDTLDRQGYAVIEDAVTPEELAAVREALAPYLTAGPYGRNDFEGFMTQRVYSLPAKSRAFDRLIEDESVLAVAESLLGPNFLLTAALAINLGPGETAQGLHYDEAFYSLPRPRPPLSLSAIWAIDDFTGDNGGTLLVPESHRWGDEGLTERPDVVPLEMPAGSVAVYPGTLWHAGGANVTDRFRLGISIQYVLSWARQQESYLLAMPPETARSVSPRLRELLGYSIGPAFMGHVDGRHPEKLVSRP
ncbi:MAG: phytanoyl-CoA dioxygenase family protein [Actinobacteria bacterium]|nr:phytanoyl-CoA dioxygenase family protein [Actinomycetota bacterium]